MVLVTFLSEKKIIIDFVCIHIFLYIFWILINYRKSDVIVSDIVFDKDA